jgi:hypothetical protein
MTQNSRRPFYAEYAWAFDLLIGLCHTRGPDRL